MKGIKTLQEIQKFISSGEKELIKRFNVGDIDAKTKITELIISIGTILAEEIGPIFKNISEEDLIQESIIIGYRFFSGYNNYIHKKEIVAELMAAIQEEMFECISKYYGLPVADIKLYYTVKCIITDEHIHYMDFDERESFIRVSKWINTPSFEQIVNSINRKENRQRCGCFRVTRLFHLAEI